MNFVVLISFILSSFLTIFPQSKWPVLSSIRMFALRTRAVRDFMFASNRKSPEFLR